MSTLLMFPMMDMVVVRTMTIMWTSNARKISEDGETQRFQNLGDICFKLIRLLIVTQLHNKTVI